MNGAPPLRRVRGAAGTAAVALSTVAVALLLGGCATGGGLSPSAGDAAAVAEAFSTAVAEGRGADACALLVPAAEEQAAAASGDCATDVLGLGLGAAGGVVSQQAYGRAAFVVLEHDTVFLAVSGDEWRVRAAGCAEQGDAPYDCALEAD
jgi:hypothetical protein